MKRTMLIFAIAIILVIAAGCGGAKDGATDDSAGQTGDGATDGQPQAQDGQQGQATTGQPGASAGGVVNPEVQKIFDKAAAIKSYASTYNTLHEKPEVVEIYVKGDNIKYKMFDEMIYQNKIHYDTVYLDKSTKTAKGYCEERNPVKCPDMDKVFTLDYDERYVETPLEWLMKFQPSQLKAIGSEIVDQRQVLVLGGELNGEPVKLWVDKFYGVPIRVEVGQSEKVTEIDTYIFSNMRVNSLKTADVTRT